MPLMLIAAVILSLGLFGLLQRGLLLYALVLYALLPVTFPEDLAVPLAGFSGITLESLVALFFVGLMGIRMFFRPRSPALSPAVIWLSWAFLGFSVLSAILMLALGQLAGMRMLHRLLFPLTAFCYVLHESPDEREILKVIRFSLLIGMVITLWGMLSWTQGGEGFRWSAGVYRLTGLDSVSNHAYAMAILAILAYALRGIRRRRPVYSLLALVFGAQVILTVTRGAIFALFLALLAYEFWGTRSSLPRRLATGSGIVLTLLLAVLCFGPLQERIFATHYQDVAARTDLSAARQLQISYERSGRGMLWRYVMHKVGPEYQLLTGYGVGRAEVDVLRDVGGVPHNEYLRVLYDTGALGLLLFLASLWQLWRLARAGVRRPRTDFHRLSAGIGIAVITLYAAGSMVDNMLNKYKIMGLFLYLLASFIVVVNFRQEKSAAPHFSGEPRTWPA